MRLREFKRFVKLHEKELSKNKLTAKVMTRKGDWIESKNWSGDIFCKHLDRTPHGITCSYICASRSAVNLSEEVIIEVPYQEISRIIAYGVVYC